MSVHVLLNLLNELGKREKMRSLLSKKNKDFPCFQTLRCCIYHANKY